MSSSTCSRHVFFFYKHLLVSTNYVGATCQIVLCLVIIVYEKGILAFVLDKYWCSSFHMDILKSPVLLATVEPTIVNLISHLDSSTVLALEDCS